MNNNFIIYIIENILLSGLFYGFYIILKKLFKLDFRSKIFIINLVGILMLGCWVELFLLPKTYWKLKLNFDSNWINFSLKNYVFYTYCFIVCLLLIIKLGGLFKLFSIRTFVKSPLIEVFPHLQKKINDISQISKIKIYFSPFHQTVSTYGILKPVIIFPIALFNQLDYKQAEYIVLHELAHIIHFDFLKKIGWEILSGILCFNPFVWLLKKEYLYLIELRADAWAVKKNHQGTSLDYIKTLVQIADFSIQPLGYTVPLVKSKSELQKRIEALIFGNKNKLNYKTAIFSLLSFGMLFIYLLTPQIHRTTVTKNVVLNTNYLININHSVLHAQNIDKTPSNLATINTPQISKKQTKIKPDVADNDPKKSMEASPTPILVDAQTEAPINADELIAQLDQIDLFDFKTTDKIDSLTSQQLINFYRNKVSNQNIFVSTENSAMIDKKINLLIFRTLLVNYQQYKERLLSLIAESNTKVLSLSQSNDLTECISMLKKIDQLTLEIFPKSVIKKLLKERL